MEFLLNLRNAVIAGLVLGGLLLAYMTDQEGVSMTLLPTLARLLHIVFAAIWLSLIWYFNIAAGRAAGEPEGLQAARAARGPAIGRLLIFAAVGTVAFGLALAVFNGYAIQMLTVDAREGFIRPVMIEIGVGAWIGILMLVNVWFVIWPNLQRAYNVGGRFKKLSPERRAAAARRALLYSRVNLMLSVPALLAMVGFAHLY